ncbi:MAG: hypothetical protein E5V91_16015 [Mesorhizobium sp.]|nr:MAG: hypothetical protein E5V91_16015 [Mesorhizobium sp.]
MKIAKELRDIFSAAEERYKRLATEVRDTLKTRVEERGWFFASRVKGLESFALKVETGRVPDPTAVEDFFGCTIVVPTIPEIAVAEAFVAEHYNGKARRPVNDKSTKKNSYSFQFDDLRLYVSRDALPSGRNPDLDGLIFEVQIKTILQHAWSIATHDLIYKSDSVSWPRERIAFQVKAMLEHAEIAIAEANSLSASPAVAKADERSISVGKVLTALKEIWDQERLPNDVKRLAETVNDLMKTCYLPPQRLAEIVEAEVARVGALPTDLSPYSFIVQAIAHTADVDFKKQLDRGKTKIVIHGGMELPDWMLQPNAKIIRIDAPVVAPADVVEAAPGAGAK